MGHSQAPLPPGQQSLSPHLPPAEMLLTCSAALPEATASGQRALPPPGPVGTVLVSSILPGLGPAVILVLLTEQPSAPSHQLPGRARPCAEGVPWVLGILNAPQGSIDNYAPFTETQKGQATCRGHTARKWQPQKGTQTSRHKVRGP